MSNYPEIKDDIISIAKDKHNNQCFPVLTNHPHSQRAFRVPDDGNPFGFEYHGVHMEVHQTHVRNVHIKGTGSFRHIPVLLIIGISAKGTRKVIAKGVLAHA